MINDLEDGDNDVERKPWIVAEHLLHSCIEVSVRWFVDVEGLLHHHEHVGRHHDVHHAQQLEKQQSIRRTNETRIINHAMRS